MSTATLTSLAILKVNIDQGEDYFSYLQPFILQVLVDKRPDPVTDLVVKDYILQKFGLEIPERTIQIVLRRLAKSRLLNRGKGVYRISGNLPDPGIAAKQSEAERHIQSVTLGLVEFSQNTPKPLSKREDAIDAICAFLAKFDITCLRAYLRGTVIPSLKGTHKTDIVLVSDYVQHLQRTQPERFNSFQVLVKGHMLANALLCPDLQNAPTTYKDVKFYFDTPLLIQEAGLESEAKENATRKLVDLLHELGGEICVFSHSRDEFRGVLLNALRYLESPDGRGAIIREARKRGTTKSDLLFFAEQIEDKLKMARIEIRDTPQYAPSFQIDEKVFGQLIDDEVSYWNERTKEFDINSVRSIYVLRNGRCPHSIEKSRAIFVTSNSAFARAAWQYEQEHGDSCPVSSVITDLGLANMAWLKAPMGSPALPMVQVLAFCYGALEPSEKLLNKYMKEIDKLEKEGAITERDHQLLRSSPHVYPELVHLTLGDDVALTNETVTAILERVSREIKREETEKLDVEKEAHLKTQDALNSMRERDQKSRERLYWRCRHRAKKFAQVLTWGFVIFVVVMSVMTASSNVLGLSPSFVVAAAIITGILAVYGFTRKRFYQYVYESHFTRLLKREAAVMGLDLSEFSSD